METTSTSSVGSEKPMNTSPYKPPDEIVRGKNSIGKSIRISLYAGCVIGTAVFVTLGMYDSSALKSFRMTVLGANNPYEIGLSRWNAPLSLLILSAFIVVSSFCNYLVLRLIAVAGICWRSRCRTAVLNAERSSSSDDSPDR